MQTHPQVAARLWLSPWPFSPGKRKHDCRERALALYESVGDSHGAARALVHLAFGLYQMGHLMKQPAKQHASACGDARVRG